MLQEVLTASSNYSTLEQHARLAEFERLAEEIADDGGYGFSVRGTEMGRSLYANWPQVLAWWMKLPGAEEPAPKDLRAW